MPVSSQIIIDQTERDIAITLHGTGGERVDPRKINNPAANQLGYGVLVGKYVASANIMNLPEYSPWHAMFSGNAIADFDSNDLFIEEEI